ncbi:unnamed protein product, partial [Symbiodinium pilosum]
GERFSTTCPGAESGYAALLHLLGSAVHQLLLRSRGECWGSCSLWASDRLTLRASSLLLG